MPSIIPNPGPVPVVPPIAEIIYTQGNGYTIGAGSTFYAFGLPTIFMSVEELITNHGTAWVESNQPHAFFVGGGSRSSVLNTGLIYVHGQSQVQMAMEVVSVVNSGSIYAVSDEGWARTIFNSTYAMTVDNSGLIAAQSLGLGSDPNYTYSPNATGIYGVQVDLNNRAGGQILAEAPNLAIGVYSGTANITNAGLIHASATTPEGISLGVYLQTGGTIINSGTIRGDFSIYATYSSNNASYMVAQVTNLAGGILDGHVFLDTGPDVMTNDGAVFGNVDMGDGNDIFSGAGTVSGYVDMGFGDDTYTGGLQGDRAVGARGNDTLRGGGGADLLLGGFGNDTLYGDAGNDGLIGEWGNDVIHTSGGDYVEGGSGNDRIVLGDYTFEVLKGGTGIDTLVLAAGARNFSLAEMAANGRATGFEVIELAADQQLAVALADVAAFTDGGNILWILGGASNTIHLGTGWVLGANVTEGGTTWESWSNGGVTVLVSLDAAVTGNSTPNFGGFDAFAGGKLAPVPGAAAGLGYSDQAVFLYNFLVGDADFTVDAEEIFYSNGAPVLVGHYRHVTTNNGTIYSIDDAFPSSLGVEVYHFVNNGLLHVEQLAEPGTVFYHPSIAANVSMIENTGEIYVYSNPGSAIAVMGMYEFNNSGTITAISEHSRAIAVNGVFATMFYEGSSHRFFYNTGLIQAEAGGLGSQTYYLGDRVVPENIAATGVQFFGTLTNDGQIIARLSAGADQSLTTAGVYAVNPYGDLAHPAGVVNNGLIQGSVAIKFEENYTYDFDTFVINNGMLIGNVEFENGNDTYTGTNGRIDGAVFGFGGNDTMTGGAFADVFHGGSGNDTFAGGGGNDTIWGDSGTDTVIYAGNRADYLVETVVIGGVTYTRVTGLGGAAGDGVDLIRRVETLQFADTSLALTTAANNLPVVAAPLADRNVSAGLGTDLATFQLSPGSFVDPDPEDTLTYRATMADGSALPWWVQFDAATQTFTVNAGQAFLGSVFNVRVYARDGNPDAGGAEVFDDFAISVVPGQGPDRIGTAGNDNMQGDYRIERLFGLAGDDTFVYSAGPDTYDGGDGSDTLDFAPAPEPLSIVLSATSGSFISIENVIGSAFADSLTGDGSANRIDGYLGNDTILGNGGSDQLLGGQGLDMISGGDGDDVFVIASLSEIVAGEVYDGGAGYDILRFNPTPTFGTVDLTGVSLISIEEIRGALFMGLHLNISQFSGLQTLDANRLSLNNGGSVSFAGMQFSALSMVSLSDSATAVDFSLASITSIFSQLTIYGGAAGDAITGNNSRSNTLYGNAGDDTLIGGAQADTLNGGNDNDNLVGGGGGDSLYGGAGNDVLDGGTGANLLFGEAGDDRLIVGLASTEQMIDGGDGIDTVALTATYALAGELVGIERIELGSFGLAINVTRINAGLASNATITGTGYLDITMSAGQALFLTQMTIASTVTISVTGTTGIDVIKGALGAAMTVSGGDGTDQIRTGNLADTIDGGAGNDKIMGLGGADELTGGTGADQFRYLFAGDSTLAAQDRILDFTTGTDKLDFRGLDADPLTAGRQTISFIGTAAFATNGTAQARYVDSGADKLVQIDLNGDGAADMQIVLVGHAGQGLTGTDFLF